METKAMILEERIRYIDSLELGEIPEVLKNLPAEPQKEGEEKRMVDGASLVTFYEDVSTESASDVLDSMLLAQLAAGKKYNQETESEKYYAMYREVLGNVGWTISSSAFQLYESSSANIDLGEVVINLLKLIVDETALQKISTSIRILKELNKESKPSLIFNSSSHTEKNGNFRVALCKENQNTVSTAISNMYFEAGEEITGVFWTKFTTANMKLHYSIQNITLNKNIYSQVREQIKYKVKEQAGKYVAALLI